MSTSRRAFLSAFAVTGAGLVVTDWPGVREALLHAEAARARMEPARFETLTPAEAADVTAAAARIIPTTDTPGATEAGVVFFFDQAFAGFAAPQLPEFRAGLADLATRAAARRPGVTGFAALSTADQDALLTEIEATPFFGALLGLTHIGMFADPSYGGNRDQVGWKLIGFENRMVNSPPFGHYDAEYAGGRD